MATNKTLLPNPNGLSHVSKVKQVLEITKTQLHLHVNKSELRGTRFAYVTNKYLLEYSMLHQP